MSILKTILGYGISDYIRAGHTCCGHHNYSPSECTRYYDCCERCLTNKIKEEIEFKKIEIDRNKADERVMKAVKDFERGLK